MLTAITGVLLVVSGGTTTANADKSKLFQIQLRPTSIKKEQTCNKWKIVKGIRFYRASTWTWNWQAGSRLQRFSKWRPRHSCAYLGYLGLMARKRARSARLMFERWYQAALGRWSCIHSHEGAWNDDNAPFWGGLQMDEGFQRAYGQEFMRLWGYANNWPVWAQLRAADRAHDSGRGYYPWPNTARACGLI